jgi:glycosyltransferase involved in cell wall biosynthesis
VRRTDGLLRGLRPGILHFTGLGPARNHPGLADSLGAKAIVRLSALEVASGGSVAPLPYKEHRDLIEVPDEATRARLRSNGANGLASIEVLRPFAPPELLAASVRRRGPEAGRPLRALSVGSLEWEAGYEYAIQSLALLRGREVEVEWRVLGDGPYAAALRFAAHQLGVEDLVSFEEPRGLAAQRHAMASADVLLAPSIINGLRQSIVDAWAMALPVVMTGPVPVEDHAIGEAAIAVSRRDPQQLAEALSQLAGDRELFRRVAAAGRRWVLECGRLEDHLDRIDTVYRRLRAEPAPDVAPAPVGGIGVQPRLPAAQTPVPALEEE